MNPNFVKKAEEIAEKYLTDTKDHCYQVAKVMKFFAKKLGENEDLRYTAGLLHDVDWDFVGKISDKHLQEDFDKIMNELRDYFSNEKEFNQFKNDLKAHAHFITGIKPETLMAKYLVSVDELSGFIYAYSLMRPTGLEGMKVKSVKKKIKNKSFASGVDREEIKNCEKFLNINLDEFIENVIEAMQN